MDARIWHKVGLELGHVDVEGTIETEGCGQRGDDLGDETVQVGVGGALNVEATTADIVEGLVIEHGAHIGVLKESMGGKGGVVRLNNRSGNLRGRVHAESELGLLSVIDGETLKEETSKTRAGTSSDGVEDHEALETSALIRKLAQAVEGEVNDLLTDGVMTAGIIVGRILLSRDELLWVVELTVGSGADLVNHGWLKIEVDATRNVLASTSLREKGVEGVITTTNSLVGWHLTIRLDAVL